MIVRSGFLLAARLRTSLILDGIDAHFVEGHELPDDVAERVPGQMVGRQLQPD